MTSTARFALGTGALFVGGLLGGLLGSVLFAERGERVASEPAGRVVVERDAELVEALQALTRELQVREAPRERPSEPSLREAVQDDGAAPVPADYGDLVAAMDRLANALVRSPAAGGGGIGLSPLALPPPGSREDRLRMLLPLDDTEASKQFRLWTYQQVLDHFGRPFAIHEGGRWIYVLDVPGGTREFTFQFMDGFLSAIYY